MTTYVQSRVGLKGEREFRAMLNTPCAWRSRGNWFSVAYHALCTCSSAVALSAWAQYICVRRELLNKCPLTRFALCNPPLSLFWKSGHWNHIDSCAFSWVIRVNKCTFALSVHFHLPSETLYIMITNMTTVHQLSFVMQLQCVFWMLFLAYRGFYEKIKELLCVHLIEIPIIVSLSAVCTYV